MTSVQEIIDVLDEHECIAESYVLVREIWVYLRFEESDFSPRIGIRIYQSSAQRDPFHFAVSHHVHTPIQASPYQTSITSASSEREAIRRAIDTTTTFITSAIDQGHVPQESWLVPNDDF